MRVELVEFFDQLVATLVERLGNHDLDLDDLIAFFVRLPNADKQFTMMAGISHASFQQKNYQGVYRILHNWFTQPDPVYR